MLAPLIVASLPNLAAGTTVAQTRAAEVQPAFPWGQLDGICTLAFFGAMVFCTVPVEMSYLLDDLGVKNSGVIGPATAIASAATVGGAISFARLKRSPDPMPSAVLGVCAVGFAVMFFAGNAPLLVVGAVINCAGTGMLLPALKD